MTRKKLIIRIILACLLITMIYNWRDLKNGFLDGLHEGWTLGSGK